MGSDHRAVCASFKFTSRAANRVLASPRVRWDYDVSKYRTALDEKLHEVNTPYAQAEADSKLLHLEKAMLSSGSLAIAKLARANSTDTRLLWHTRADS